MNQEEMENSSKEEKNRKIKKIFQSLQQLNFPNVIRKLEMESKIFFNLESFWILIKNGEWNRCNKYLNAFLSWKEEKDMDILFLFVEHRFFEMIYDGRETQELFEYLKRNEMIQLQQYDSETYKKMKSLAMEDDPLQHPIMLQNKFGEGIEEARNYFNERITTLLRKRFPLETSKSSLDIPSKLNRSPKLSDRITTLKKFNTNLISGSPTGSEEYTLVLGGQIASSPEPLTFGKKKTRTQSVSCGDVNQHIVQTKSGIDNSTEAVQKTNIKEEKMNDNFNTSSDDEKGDIPLDLNATPEMEKYDSLTTMDTDQLNPFLSFQSKLESPLSSPSRQSSSLVPQTLQSSTGSYSLYRDPRIIQQIANFTQQYPNFTNNSIPKEPESIQSNNGIQCEDTPLITISRYPLHSKWEKERKHIIQKNEKPKVSPSKEKPQTELRSKSPLRSSHSKSSSRKRSRSPSPKRNNSSKYQSNNNDRIAKNRDYISEKLDLPLGSVR